MSNTYAPDKWVVVEITTKLGDKHRKVLGSWYGGFAKGDSWRLSSGITAIHDRTTHWEIENESGSVYTCYKNCEGMSGYTMGIFSSFEKQMEDAGGTIKRVSQEDL